MEVLWFLHWNANKRVPTWWRLWCSFLALLPASTPHCSIPLETTAIHAHLDRHGYVARDCTTKSHYWSISERLIILLLTERPGAHDQCWGKKSLSGLINWELNFVARLPLPQHLLVWQQRVKCEQHSQILKVLNLGWQCSPHPQRATHSLELNNKNWELFSSWPSFQSFPCPM